MRPIVPKKKPDWPKKMLGKASTTLGRPSMLQIVPKRKLSLAPREMHNVVDINSAKFTKKL
jgi:hypothetical protein